MSKSILWKSAICLFISLSAIIAASKKHVPTAPLPDAVINAKRIFVPNGGGSNLAFDAFYSALKRWGKYTFVGSPNDADLIIELAYRADYGRTRILEHERCARRDHSKFIAGR